MSDNTLGPTTVAALPSDGVYAGDAAAAVAAGNGPLAATEAQNQADRDLAAWRAANLS